MSEKTPDPKIVPGEDAGSPVEIGRAGWMEISKRVLKRLKDDRVSFISAAVAFYILLGLFPMLGALLSIYGLISDPVDVMNQLRTLEGIVPADVLALVDDELKRVASQEKLAGFGLIFGIGLALWGGAKAMTAMITAMNVAYREKDTRNFVKQKLLGLGLTGGAVIFLVVAVALLGAIPAILSFTGIEGTLESFLHWLRWPALFLIALFWLAMIYRYAPARKNPKWRWVTPGSLLATILWVAGSVGFSWYAASFGSYSKTYGSIGVIILLLMWLYISAFAVMLGAELNAETELQTRKDSTVGEPEELGERGAYVADYPEVKGRS